MLKVILYLFKNMERNDSLTIFELFFKLDFQQLKKCVTLNFKTYNLIFFVLHSIKFPEYQIKLEQNIRKLQLNE